MKGGAEARGLLSRLARRLRPARDWFLRWRREHWQVRALIVLLLGLYFMLQPRIVDLVDIAIQGIFAGSEPKLAAAATRYHKATEADRLRRALRVHLRAGGDDAARDLGITPRDLEGPSLSLDLNGLVRAARSARLIRDSYTARTVRRRALALGRVDTEEIFGPARAEIAEELRKARSSGRRSLKSWIWVTYAFVDFGLGIFGPGDWITSAAWLFFCYHVCRLAAALWGRRARWMAPLLPPAILLAAAAIALFFRDWRWYYDHRIVSGLLTSLGWSLITFCAALSGRRSRPPEARSGRERLRALLPVTVCLAAWGILSLIKRPLSLWIRPSCRLLGWAIPIWWNVAFAVLGLAGLLAILVLLRRQALTGDG